MVPSLGAVDSEGRAASPGLLYGDHRGATAERDPAFPGDTGELLAFLSWLTSAAPGAAGYWPAQAVANHALTGRAAIDLSTALTALPLYGRHGWDEELAAAAGTTTATLPHVVAVDERVGTVRAGLPAAGAAVGAGTIDALAEQVVAGADDVGDVLVICGGTQITWAVAADWPRIDGLWTIPHTAAGRALVGGPSNSGGLFLDTVDRWITPATDDELDAVDPDDLPVWLPYVRGERTPLHRRDLSVELHGATRQHGPAELRRAAYDATGFVVRHHLDLVRAAGVVPTRIVATGGGTRSRHWMRALADATGLPVDVVAVPEGAALGAAFLARCTAGLEPELAAARRWARTGHRVEPDEARTAAAARGYERFRELTDAAVARQP